MISWLENLPTLANGPLPTGLGLANDAGSFTVAQMCWGMILMLLTMFGNSVESTVVSLKTTVVGPIAVTLCRYLPAHRPF